MAVSDFTDPKGFIGESVYHYIDPVRAPARIKHQPIEFIVLEPAHGRPGHFLSNGRETDYPEGAINFPYGNCPSGEKTGAMPWYGYAPVTPGVTADRCTAAILTVNDGTQLQQALDSLRTKLGLREQNIRHRLLSDRNGKRCVEVVVEGCNPDEMRRRILGEEPFLIHDLRVENATEPDETVWFVLTARTPNQVEHARNRLMVKLGVKADQCAWRRIGKAGRGNMPDRFEMSVTGMSLNQFREKAYAEEPYRVEHHRHAFMAILTLVKERLTTMAAIDWMCAALSKALNREVRSKRVTNSGLKDRWAVTAQSIVIEGVTVEEVSRCLTSMPAFAEGRAGFLLKDPRFAYDRLYKGDHKTNRFNIVVRSDMSAEQIEAYLRPRLEKLRKRGFWVPNAFGRQRLGRRQNLHCIGRTMVTNDFKAPAGVHAFGSACEAASYRFMCETTPSEPAEVSEIRRKAEEMWLYNFRDMRNLFEQYYRQHNLAIEFKMADRIADIDRYGGSFERVIESMWDECSLFVAAWQSWWWNRVLTKKLFGWVREMDHAIEMRERKDGVPCTCEAAPHVCHEHDHDDDDSAGGKKECEACKCAKCSRWTPTFNPSKKSIPLLMATQQARNWYGQLHYARESVRELSRADAAVRDMFLVPRNRNDGSPKEFGPWRKAFIRVENQKHEIGNGYWRAQFDLRAGAYATSYLLLLWDLLDPENQSRTPGEASCLDVDEITD